MRTFALIFATIVALLAPSLALAGKTQVNSSTYKTAGSYGGRSDGVFQDSTSKGIVVIENGTPATLIGPTFYEDFSKWGSTTQLTCFDWTDASACAGDTTTVAQLLTFPDGLKLISFPLATATIPPVITATGLDITGDLTNDEGFEVVAGEMGATGRPFTIGKDPAFYTCMTVKIADVDGTDDFHTGFRRAEPFTATYDNYNDLASIGNISGNIYIETILNNAATVSTDTGNDWADAESHKLCTFVSGTGVVTYTIDGAAPTTTAAFTFDAGDPVVPFVHLLHDANIAETTAITKWEVGYSN